MSSERARSVLRVFVVGAILVLGLAQPAGAEPLVETEGEPTALTLPAQETATFFVGLTPVDGVELDSATVDVSAVTHDGRPFGANGRADDAITASTTPGDDRVELQVKVDELIHHGTYAVGILLTIPGGGAADDRTQQLSLTVTRPPAVLSVPEVVEVERTRRLGQSGDDTDPNVLIRPDDMTRLSELTVTVIDPDPHGVRTDSTGGVTETLVGSDDGTVRTAVEPGGSLPLELVLTDELPLGSIDRTVELNSPQLAEPKIITYRISARRHPGWIVSLIALGLLLGLIARRLPGWLTHRVSLYRRWAALGSQLSGLVKRYSAAPELKQIETLSARVTKGPGLSTGNAEIEEILDDGTTTANGWVTKLNADLEPLAARLETAAAPIRLDWTLLDEAQERLKAARVHDNLAIEQLKTGAVEALTSTIGTVERSVINLRTTVARTAGNETADRMDDLAEVLDGQDRPRRLNTVRAQLAAIRADGRNEVEGESTIDALSRLHRMRWAVENLTEELRVVATQLPIVLNVPADGKDDFDTALAELNDALAADDPEARLVDLANRLQAVYALHDSTHAIETADDSQRAHGEGQAAVATVVPNPQLIAAAAYAPANRVAKFARATQRLTGAVTVGQPTGGLDHRPNRAPGPESNP